MSAGQRGDGSAAKLALAVHEGFPLTRRCARAGGGAGPRAGRRDDGRGRQAGGARPGRHAAGARAHGAQARPVHARLVRHFVRHMCRSEIVEV